ncbi:MAG: hypothetical protein APF76_07730 [Desulfitibacter sp. BRH_c19]|nr:MAG: hypothetical protein APF76_07730 [Desulfitibacter sp. BRH_c19]
MIFYLILLGVFLTVILLTIGIYTLIFSSRLKVLNRIDTYANVKNSSYSKEDSKAKGFREEFFNLMGALGKLFSREAYKESIQRKLNQAHVLMKAEEFFGVCLATALGIFLLLFLISRTLILAITGGLLGFKLPNILLDIKKKKRMRALNSQLPEALTIISNGLRAGFSFPQAMSVVSKEMEAPIAEEFGRVIRENSLGKPMEEALQNLSDRTDDEDLDMFITALLIQRQVGGNLAEVLDNISNTIRERIRIKGEIRTLTAQGRLSAIIICALPAVVAGIITLMNPEYMLVLIQETMGLIMIGTAVFFMIVGVILIRRIVDIKV